MIIIFINSIHFPNSNEKIIWTLNFLDYVYRPDGYKNWIFLDLVVVFIWYLKWLIIKVQRTFPKILVNKCWLKCCFFCNTLVKSISKMLKNQRQKTQKLSFSYNRFLDDLNRYGSMGFATVKDILWVFFDQHIMVLVHKTKKPP